MKDASDLVAKACTPCEGGTEPLGNEEVSGLLSKLNGWELVGSEIVRTYTFKNYYQTIAFVNALAWIAHREDHHPDLAVAYKTCTVRYSTHSIGGLSENDFICAAKIDALVKA